MKLKEVGRYSLSAQYGNAVVIEYVDEKGETYRYIMGIDWAKQEPKKYTPKGQK